MSKNLISKTVNLPYQDSVLIYNKYFRKMIKKVFQNTTCHPKQGIQAFCDNKLNFKS